MDAEKTGIPCPHQETSYEVGYRPTSGSSIKYCEQLEYGSCKWQVCRVETMFD